MKAMLSRIPAWIGLAFWISLCGVRLIEALQTARLIPAMLAAQAGLVAALLVARRAQTAKTKWWRTIAAWASAFIPLLMAIQHESLYSQAITSFGLGLVLWSMEVLGGSFGIAPADRGLVRHGPYRVIRHPMYLGELISLVGAVTGDLSHRNIILIHVLLLTLFVRIHWEEQALGNYARYARQVRWRMLPGIW